nr:MAG TPA: hypothetical protein [Caudoviricetes sp.]DAL69241.1 MAG TPA: hypothetical protein [Caudoviricetes sp.]
MRAAALPFFKEKIRKGRKAIDIAAPFFYNVICC